MCCFGPNVSIIRGWRHSWNWVLVTRICDETDEWNAIFHILIDVQVWLKGQNEQYLSVGWQVLRVSKTESQTAKTIPVLSNTCDRYICQGVLKCTTSLPRFRYVNRIHMEHVEHELCISASNASQDRRKRQNRPFSNCWYDRHKTQMHQFFGVTSLYSLLTCT